MGAAALAAASPAAGEVVDKGPTGKMLRMQGALSPLQGSRVASALT